MAAKTFKDVVGEQPPAGEGKPEPAQAKPNMVSIEDILLEIIEEDEAAAEESDE